MIRVLRKLVSFFHPCYRIRRLNDRSDIRIILGTQCRDELIYALTAVLDDAAVPNLVQVGLPTIEAYKVKKPNRLAVSPTIIVINVVQRLMHIADEMNDES